MDPIDGTSNLVKQQDYCIILGYFIDGEPKLHIFMIIHIKDYIEQLLGAYENIN